MNFKDNITYRNQGISYADGRLNTNSTSYKTGYNTGITDADSRINKNSASYTTGYNQGYIDGQNLSTSSTQIKYYYHEHSGSELSGGGCYNTPVYHTHNSYSCYKPCGGTLGSPEYVQLENGQTWHVKVCQKCGGWTNSSSTDVTCNIRTSTIICGKTTSTVESYQLNCGKTAETIESATITFD